MFTYNSERGGGGGGRRREKRGPKVMASQSIDERNQLECDVRLLCYMLWHHESSPAKGQPLSRDEERAGKTNFHW